VTRSSALVPIGVVVAAHGVRGELRVKLHNPASTLLGTHADVIVRRGVDDAGRRVAVRSARAHGQGIVRVALDGCADRDAALALRGAELCVPRAELPELPEGEHYLIDLIGLEARTPDGRAAGRVQDVIEYPAAQVLRVAVAGGVREVPLLSPYVLEIRLDEGTLIVDHLEDLELEPPR
jgi:16S rRNA processing protein RimM